MARLSEDEIGQRLRGLEGWERGGRRDQQAIRVRRLQGIGRSGRPAGASRRGAQPPSDLQVSWSTVTVSITTHSQGGLTESDFELASRIDAID